MAFVTTKILALTAIVLQLRVLIMSIHFDGSSFALAIRVLSYSRDTGHNSPKKEEIIGSFHNSLNRSWSSVGEFEV